MRPSARESAQNVSSPEIAGLVKAVALPLAALLLAAAPAPAPAAYFYDWASPSITDPVGDFTPNYDDGRDITAAWHAFDGASHYFRMDLLAAPDASGDTYGVFLDSRPGVGAPVTDKYIPQGLPEGIDFILSSTYGVVAWDPEFSRWTSGGFKDSEDIAFQDLMNGGTTLEWKVRETSGGAKYIGSSFTWWGATMLVPHGSGASITYDVTDAVPIPNAVWLFGSGLVALIGLKRRKGAKT